MRAMAKAPVLTPQSEDFPRWYQDLINKAELADNGPVRGTMVIRPYGYGLWERMQQEMDARIKDAGAQNAYFPLFIPQSYLTREAEHVEGFAPELAVVTHGGGKELEEPVVVRPTSETIINDYFSKWIQSYRDLPLLINQWANVVRWEMRPRVFLRTTEFLWQEGHTAHATYEDARDYAAYIHKEVYADFMVNVLGIDVVLGRKTPRERFAGAINTLTLEGMMGDGKALQMGTSHELGTNFSKAFNTTYLSKDGRQELAWQTSWGSSTRMVGGLIMSHGDDNGLRVPPRLAAVQVVVMAIKGDEAVAKVREIGDRLKAAGLRVQVDDRTDTPSAAARSTGSSRACRYGSRSDRGTWRRAPRCWPAVSREARSRCASMPWPSCCPRFWRRTRRSCCGSRASAVSPVRPRCGRSKRPPRPRSRAAGRESRGRRWARRVRPGSPSRRCPYGVWSPRTGRCRRPTTPPVLSRSWPAPTEA